MSFLPKFLQRPRRALKKRRNISLAIESLESRSLLAPVVATGVVQDLSVIQSSGYSSMGLTNVTFANGQGASNPLSYTITAVPDAALGFLVDGTGTTLYRNSNTNISLSNLQNLTFFATPNATGAATFSFSVEDSSGTLYESIDITVTPSSGPLYKVIDLNPTLQGFNSSQGAAIDGAMQGGRIANVIPNNGSTVATHAAIWTGTPESVVDLHPSGPDESVVLAISGDRQAGYAHDANGDRAYLWKGTAASAVNLNPPGSTVSTASGIAGDQVVGFTQFSGQDSHAFLWTGLDGTIQFQDLHPQGYKRSSASATDGTYQVGQATLQGASPHAALWNGTSASLVDLHPAGTQSSFAWAVQGGHQGGVYDLDANTPFHAALWSGTAASFVDLHPSGYAQSEVHGIFGDYQVGFAVLAPTNIGQHHAMLWSGTAASVINLNNFLPIAYEEGNPTEVLRGSRAYGIDANGNIIGISYGDGAVAHAVMWVPISPVRTAGNVADLVVQEDSGLTSLGLSAINYIPGGGAEGALQTLTYKVTALPNSILGNVVLADGVTVVAVGAEYSLTQLRGMQFNTARNANGTANFAFDVKDSGGTADGGRDTLSESLSITITPINDVPARIAGSISNLAVLEDSGLTSLGFAGLAYSPVDLGQSLSYTVTAVPSPILGSILLADGTTPVTAGTNYSITQLQGMQFKPAADVSGGPAFFRFDVKDNGGTANGGKDTLAQALTITVTTVNDAPTFTKGPNTGASLDGGPQTVTGWAKNISAGPTNEALQPMSFQVIDNSNPGLFAAGPAVSPAGDLTYTPAAGATGTATITLVLRDSGGTANGGSNTSDPQSFTITVAVNSAPSFTVGPGQTVAEDAGPQTVNAWATALLSGAPVDAWQVRTFVITENSNPALFAAGPAVNGETGALSFTPARNANGTATITLVVKDNGGTAGGGQDTSAPQSFSITITPVNDVPARIAGSIKNLTVVENSGLTSLGFAGLAYSPVDLGQTLSFKVTAVPPASLGTIVLADGTTVVTAGTSYSIEQFREMQFNTAPDVTGGPAFFRFEVQDDGGTADGGKDTLAQAMLITVAPVNIAPSFTNGVNQTVNEDSGPRSVSAWATNISRGSAAEASQTLQFQVAGNTNPGLFSAGPAVSPTGILSFTPAANAFGSATISLVLKDSGGTAGGGSDTSAAETFTITVNPVNDAPLFVKGANPTVLRNSGPFSQSGWATDLSAGANESSQGLTFQVVGNTNPSLFSFGPVLNASSGTLAFTPAANMTGIATITVVLKDNGGTSNGGEDTSAPQSFVITVNPPNTAPSFLRGVNVTTFEDAGPRKIINWAKIISPGPALDAGQSVAFQVTGNTNPGLFSAGPVIDPDGTLTFTPASDAYGTATISLVLKDNGGTASGGQDTSAPQSFTITVTPINDAPSFVKGPDQTVAGDAGPANIAGWATQLSAGPGEANQGLTFQITGNTNASLFSFSPVLNAANGNLAFTPADGASGTATISVVLKDDGGTTGGGKDTSPPQSFVIEVTPVTSTLTFAAPVGLLSSMQTQNHLAPLVTLSDHGAAATAVFDSDASNERLTVDDTRNIKRKQAIDEVLAQWDSSYEKLDHELDDWLRGVLEPSA